MLRKELRKEFLRFVIPSVFAFMLSGFYSIVDGFFVGQVQSDAGLSAVSYAYPLAALFQAFGTGVGMGAAIRYSITDNEEEKKKIFASCLTMLGMLSILFTVVFYFISGFLMKAQGASGQALKLGEEYMRIISLGATLQVFSTGLVPLVRNFKGSFISMISMVAGCVVNIFLDWFLVVYLKNITIEQGLGTMYGAAYATLAGQLVTVIITVGFIIYKKVPLSFKFTAKKYFTYTGHNVTSSISPIGITYSANIALILLNIFATKVGGDIMMSTYSTIGYITFIVQMLMQGVGDGCQPLLSKYQGENNRTAVIKIRKYSLITSLSLGLVSVILVASMHNILPTWFNTSQAVTDMFSYSIFYFVVGFPFFAISRGIISYFYAIEKKIPANILTYIEPFFLLIFLSALGLGLPSGANEHGVWISTPISQLLLAVASVIFLIYEIKLDKKRENLREEEKLM